MPLDLGHDPARGAPGLGLVAEAGVVTPDLVGLPTRGQAPNVTCLVLTLERSAMFTWSKTLRAGARRRGHSWPPGRRGRAVLGRRASRGKGRVKSSNRLCSLRGS